MRTLPMAVAGAALFGSVLMLPGATEAQNLARGIPGFLDPSTGLFTARPSLLPGAATLQRSGTITVTITAVLGSNIPPSVPVTCFVSISSSDTAADNFASGSGAFTRSGKGGTCKLAIPYIFEVAAPSTTMFVSASLSATTSTTPSLTYSASHSFTPFAVPNGKKSLTVTLAM
jgi:hypothetical protein